MEWHIVTGSKGGVGKTLLSLLLLAHCLKKEKRQQGSTLILDLNGMNADSTALVLYQTDSPTQKTLPLNTTVELYLQNAKDIQFREARFDDEKHNAQRYIVGWPANPFILMNPKLFADLLKTITSKVSTLGKDFGFEKLRHIIIDTNYHFVISLAKIGITILTIYQAENFKENRFISGFYGFIGS
ncbi:MAG: hypothetical protein HC877_03205 [Thioploca sp.]|nr:hypothetical protein [Thioploca sp.]